MKKKVFRSRSHNPYFNIAAEHWIFNNYHSQEDILYLWCNEPSVIIGRYQNPWKECKLSLMKEKNIHLVRRESGGGAVFHDLGNGIFSFFSPFEDEESEKRNYGRLIKSLKTFGIESFQSSRNDLTLNFENEIRKISGNAFKKRGSVRLHHGTMLINSNLEELGDYLTPNPKKLESKGIASVRSRVINLQEVSSNITVESFHSSLEKIFWEETPELKPSTIWIDENLLESEPYLKEQFESLQNSNWVLGKTPEFNHIIEEYFEFGSWSIHLQVESARIVQVQIFTDCLSVQFVEQVLSTLEGKPYSETGIKEAFKILKNNCDSMTSAWAETLEDWILKSIS